MRLEGQADRTKILEGGHGAPKLLVIFRKDRVHKLSWYPTVDDFPVTDVVVSHLFPEEKSRFSILRHYMAMDNLYASLCLYP